MKSFLFPLLLWLIFSGLQAQGVSQPYFRHFGTDEGLPSSEVYGAIQDASGYIWFCTDNGISRFDGYSFRNYNIRDGLPESCILRFTKDTRGRIWLDGLSRKVYLMDPKGGFPPYPFNELKNNFAQRNFSGQELFWSESQQKMVFSLQGHGILEIDSMGRPTLETDTLGGLVLKNYDGSWFVANTAYFTRPAIERAWKQHGKCLKISVIDNNQRREFWMPTASPYNFVKFWPLSEGRLLVSHSSLGSKTESLSLFKNGQLLETFQVDANITNILEDSYHGFWICFAEGGGLRHYLNMTALKTGKYQLLLPGKSVSNVLWDQSGGLWVSTLEDGVFYCANLQNRLYNNLQPGQRDFISAIETAGDSILFFSTLDGRVYQIQSPKMVAESLGTPFNMVCDLCWMPSGQQLAVASPNEFCVLEHGQKRLCTYWSATTKTWCNLGANRISVARDSKSIFLIRPRSFLQYTPKTGLLPQLPGPDKLSYNKRILDVLQDQQGTVWVGTIDGLYVYDADTLRRAPWTHPALNRRIEDIEAYPSAAALAGQPSLAIGTKGEGIVLIQGDHLTQITTNDGLTSNVIERIFVEPNGTLWASTQSGLNQIIPQANGGWQVLTYSYEHGFPSNEITEVRTWGGHTWVGTAKGLVQLAPARLNPVSPPPGDLKLHINGLDMPGSVFSHDQNNLEISYLTLNFKLNGHIRYRYRLHKHNPWKETVLTQVNFAALSPGNYCFEVQSQNEDRIWSESVQLPFEILRPWYLSWWFLGLALIAIGGIFWAWHRSRTQKLEKQLALQHQLTTLEQQALQARMNPHFIFNCLNLIQNYIAEGDKENAMRYIALFAQLTRNILYFSEKTSISLDEEITLLKNYLELQVLRLGNNLHFSVEKGLDIDPLDVFIPPMLVQPFVENAIVHGRSGFIKVSFERAAPYIIVTISNIGPGKGVRAQADHQSRSVVITRKRLGFWNSNDSPDNLTFEYQEKGVCVTIKILEK